MPDDKTNPTVEADATPVEAVQSEPTPTVTSPNNSSGKKKKLGLMGIIIAAAIVLIGGGAGAYYGVIAPNKPENVLKAAAQNLLEQRKYSNKGNISVDMKGEDAPLKNVTVTFTSSSDTDKQAFAINLEASASGVKLPVEMRSVEQNLYFKVGDLGSIKGVAALAEPEAIGIIDAIGSKLSNQWIEVDQSLLKQASLDCVTNSVNSLSKKDIDQLMKLYSDNQFVTIKNKVAEKIDGVDTTRYELGLDEQKAEAFAGKLDTVEGLKKAAECGKTATDKAGDSGDTEVNKDDDKAKPEVTFNVWIDKSKKLRQLQVKASDKEVSATVTIVMTNEKVDIQKPEGAKPLLQVLGDFSALFSGSGGLGGFGGQIPDMTNDDALSASCLEAYQAFVTSGGTTALPAECQ